jgi:hypothetical protein
MIAIFVQSLNWGKTHKSDDSKRTVFIFMEGKWDKILTFFCEYQNTYMVQLNVDIKM